MVPFAKQGAGVSDEIVLGLYMAARDYDFSKDPYVLELQERDDLRSRTELGKVLVRRKTYCWENLRALDLRARAIHEQLRSQLTERPQPCMYAYRKALVRKQIL